MRELCPIRIDENHYQNMLAKNDELAALEFDNKFDDALDNEDLLVESFTESVIGNKEALIDISDALRHDNPQILGNVLMPLMKQYIMESVQ